MVPSSESNEARREIISRQQQKVAALARIEPTLELTTLAHHIDLVWLRETYRRARKESMAGVAA